MVVRRINVMYEELIEEIMAIDDHEDVKTKHRKSRKARRKITQRDYSRNYYIGKTASSYGKKMIHRYNRRVRGLNLTASDYHKHVDFSYSSILWAMS